EGDGRRGMMSCVMPAVMRRAAVALALAAAACTVGRKYKGRPVDRPDVYRGATPAAEDAANGPSLADQKWWELFQDEELQELIRTALRQNFDGRIAGAGVAGARAQRGITGADQFPRVDASVLA